MKKLFSLIKESLASHEERNYTSMGINTAIVLLSVPMVIEMFFEALFALVDAFFVARYVGVGGVAVVGLTESVLTLIYSLAWGLAGAATAIIARRIGEKNYPEASQYLGQILLISIVLGLLIAVFGYWYSADILAIMGAKPQIITDGLWYTKIQFLSSPIIILLFSLGGVLRGAGMASSAMKAVIIANIINILLDFLFVAYLGMGVKGAALATLIGRSVGIGLQLRSLFGQNSYLQLLFRQIRPKKQLILSVLSIATGTAGQFLIQSASWVFLVRILSNYGSEVVAGYTIAIRVIIFTILPSWGLANAAATLVGQNLGAGQPQRAAQSAWRIGFINVGFLAVVAVLFLIFSRQIMQLFDHTAAVVDTGSSCLIIMALGYVVFGIGMVIVQAINGAGDSLTPTLLNFVCFWLIEIPLAYYLAQNLHYKQNGVFAAIVIAETIMAFIAMAYFRSGRWQQKKV
jgi:putative MATE family efflux protein